MPTDQTRFTPAPADAIVLFSDAQFDLPSASPPIYIVADEGLENISDASVQQLELRGGELSATLANAGARRAVSFEGTTGAATVPVYPGTTVIDRPISGAGVAGAKLNPGDLSPENDSLWLRRRGPNGRRKVVDRRKFPSRRLEISATTAGFQSSAGLSRSGGDRGREPARGSLHAVADGLPDAIRAQPGRVAADRRRRPRFRGWRI